MTTFKRRFPGPPKLISTFSVMRINKRIVSKPYRRHMRRISMALNNDTDLLEKVLSRSLDPAQIAEKTSNSKNNIGEIGKLLFNENKLDEIKW